MVVVALNIDLDDMTKVFENVRLLYGRHPLPAPIFNYHKCKTWEIRNFFASRKPDIAFTTRANAILELEKADKTAIFRLLDLPGELRNHVYGVLLTIRNVPHFVGPAQVYGEAHGFLYGENDFTINFKAETAPQYPGRYQLMCDVCGLRPSALDRLYKMGMGEYMDLQEERIDWLEYLRRAEELTVKIDLPRPPSGVPFGPLTKGITRTFAAINRALYDLACFLLVKSDAKEIKFAISGGLDKLIKLVDVANILSPIRLFPSKKTFALRHLATSIAESVQVPDEKKLLEHLNTLTKAGNVVAFMAARKLTGEGVDALVLGEKYNTPETHKKLLEVLDQLNVILASIDIPVYKGDDAKVVKEVEILKLIRKTLGR